MYSASLYPLSYGMFMKGHVFQTASMKAAFQEYHKFSFKLFRNPVANRHVYGCYFYFEWTLNKLVHMTYVRDITVHL